MAHLRAVRSLTASGRLSWCWFPMFEYQQIISETVWVSGFCGKSRTTLGPQWSGCSFQLGPGLELVILLWASLLVNVSLCPCRHRNYFSIGKEKKKLIFRTKQCVEYVFSINKFNKRKYVCITFFEICIIYELYVSNLRNRQHFWNINENVIQISAYVNAKSYKLYVHFLLFRM